MSQQLNNASASTSAEKNVAQGDAAIVDKDAVSIYFSLILFVFLFTYLSLFHS